MNEVDEVIRPHERRSPMRTHGRGGPPEPVRVSGEGGRHVGPPLEHHVAGVAPGIPPRVASGICCG